MNAMFHLTLRSITQALLVLTLCFTFPALLIAGETALDINTATAKQLESLKGIGSEIAKRIVEFREANGPFKSVDELQKIKGIGKGKLAQIQDKLTVGIAAQSSGAKGR